MIEIGPFRLDLINDGFFEDEADTFVRRCAEEHAPPKSKARGKLRVRVGFNSLLIRGMGRTIVVDPGTGDKPRADKAQAYTLEWPRQFFSTLAKLSVRPEDVDTVILTHLHWDHAGAATRLDAGGSLVPSFPKAKYVVQKLELDAARGEIAKGDFDNYLGDDFEPLARTGILETIEGDVELHKGIGLRWVGGHSAGLQIVHIGLGEAAGATYTSDLIPTSAQIPLDCYLSYDLDAEQLTAAKKQVLIEAARRHDLLLFVHAPRMRAGYPVARPDGSFGIDSLDV